MAGIILVAVGDEIVIAHPTQAEGISVALAIAGGQALYLIGHQLFRLRMTGTTSGARWIAIAALLATVVLGGVLAPLGIAIVATGVVVLLVAYETRERLAVTPPLASGG